MTNAVQVSTDFQQRLFEKIRTDIGSLMTDEEIKKLVESAIERIWFTPTTVGDYYNRKTDPPKLTEIVREAAGPKIKEVAAEWIAAHPDEVTAALEKVLAGGMSAAILRAFDQMLASNFQLLQMGLQETLRVALQRNP